MLQYVFIIFYVWVEIKILKNVLKEMVQFFYQLFGQLSY